MWVYPPWNVYVMYLYISNLVCNLQILTGDIAVKESNNYSKQNTMAICGKCAIILSVLIGILYFPYLTGSKVFLFPTMINDGIYQFYPNYVEAARNLSDGLTHFSLQNGWGFVTSIKNPFEILIICFGEENVAYMMGLVTALRPIIAGTIFAAYLKEREMEDSTCLLFGVYYAFSLQIVGGGAWNTQAELAIVAALCLLALERIKKRKGIIVTIAAIVLIQLCLNIYYKLTLAAFLMLYIVGRYLIENTKGISKLNKKKKVIAFVAVFILVMILLIISRTMLTTIFASYRFKLGVESLGAAWSMTFSHTNIKILATAILRTFAPNILGIPGVTTYYGGEYGWYIGDGGFYCGIMSIIIFPQLFTKENKRVNIIYLIGLLGCALIIVCPAVRLIANGFADRVFKLTRMWITLVFILGAVRAFNDIARDREQLNLKKLYITWGMCVSIFLIIVISPFRARVYYYDVILTLIIGSGIVLVLTLWKKNILANNKLIGATVAIVSVEVIAINYGFINNDDSIFKSQLSSSFYNDGTSEAIEADINHDDGLYRIDKNYMSVFLDDGKVQGYNGTSYYVGGISNQNRTDFIVNLGLPTLYNQRGYCAGTYGKAEISTLLGVKYGLAKDGIYNGYGYELIADNPDIDVYENRNYLSMAIGFDKVISYEDFEKLPLENREKALLSAVVVDDIDGNLQEVSDSEMVFPEVEPLSYQSIDNYTFGDVVMIDELQENQTLVVDLEDEEEESFQLYLYKNGEWQASNHQFGSIYKENGKCQIKIDNQAGAQAFVIWPYSTKEITNIDKVEIRTYDTQQYYQYYDECISELKESTMEIIEHTNTYISGTIDLDADQLLFISIPYNTPFAYYVDGEKVEKYRVDYAFTGILVKSGMHTIEMKYEN